MNNISYVIGYDSNDISVAIAEFVPNIEKLSVESEEKDPKLFISYREKLPLRRFLNMGLRDFVEKFPQYEFLHQQLDFKLIDNHTFADIISALKKHGYKHHFSTVNGIIKSFSLFKIEGDGDKIGGVKVLSLDPTKEALIFFIAVNGIFSSFINSQDISKISWVESNKSPSNALYRELIAKYKGAMREIDDRIYYRLYLDIER